MEQMIDFPMRQVGVAVRAGTVARVLIKAGTAQTRTRETVVGQDPFCVKCKNTGNGWHNSTSNWSGWSNIKGKGKDCHGYGKAHD